MIRLRGKGWRNQAPYSDETLLSLLVVAIAFIFLPFKLCAKMKKGWPEEISVVQYDASVNKSKQSMLVYLAKSEEIRPLLVGLHTWSGTYKQAGGETVYARWCIEQDWHFIHPDFRGPNWTADACGSDKVVQDILDAVKYMQIRHKVDPNRIYLVGVSGGGYASLLMAGRAPKIWAGVSAWVPISDIYQWWKQTDEGRYSKYARYIEKVVGARPDQNNKARQECRRRSAVTYLNHAKEVNLDINGGVTDGHDGGSVPFTHSLYAFNEVVPKSHRIRRKQIEEFYKNQSLPEGLEKAREDPLYGKKEVVFRKTYKNTRVSIFQGGHEIIYNAALNWLASQRKGEPAKWEVQPLHDLGTNEKESESGK